MLIPKTKPEKGKKVYPKRTSESVAKIGAHVPRYLLNAIHESNTTVSKAVCDALDMYFRDHYKNKLEQAIFVLYEVMFDLEKLQEKGQIGFTKFSEAHSLQLDSYKEAIRILENSPLFLPPEDPE